MNFSILCITKSVRMQKQLRDRFRVQTDEDQVSDLLTAVKILEDRV